MEEGTRRENQRDGSMGKTRPDAAGFEEGSGPRAKA